MSIPFPADEPVISKCAVCGSDSSRKAEHCSQCGSLQSKPMPGFVQLAVKLLKASLWFAASGLFIGIPIAVHQLGDEVKPIQLMWAAICFTIIWLIIGRIERGRVFARKYMVVVCAFSILFATSVLGNLYLEYWDRETLFLGIFVGCGNIILELIALILLYQKQSTDWFRGIEAGTMTIPAVQHGGLTRQPSRTLRKKYIRNLAIAGIIACIGAIYYLNCDVVPPSGRYDEVVIGQVDSVHYHGTSQEEGTGTYRKTDLHWKNGAGTLSLCGEQSFRFNPGQNYRIEVKAIDWDHEHIIDSCLRIVHLEGIGSDVQVEHLSGRMTSLTPVGDYSFQVDVEDSNHSKQSVTLCDDPLGPAAGYASGVLDRLKNNSAWDSVTVFYNKAGKSREYDCYPLLVLRNDKSNVIVESQNIPLLYSDQSEILRQYGILVPLTQSEARDILSSSAQNGQGATSPFEAAVGGPNAANTPQDQVAPASKQQVQEPEEDSGTWTDTATGLMWTKNDNGSDVNWQQATDYCENLNLAGQSDWRLPTIDELQGIYDSSISAPNQSTGGQAVPWQVKGNLKLSAWGEWSSSQGNAPGQAWVLGFGSGTPFSYRFEGRKKPRALCVRR